MSDLILFQNWDLLVLGIVIIVTAILGFIVYFENPKSPTRRSFLGFTLATAVWGIFNYLSYHIQPPLLAFYFLKLTIFAVTWLTFFFLNFSLVFPREETFSRNRFRWILPSIAFLVAALTLTPFVFETIGDVSSTGTITRVVNGPAIPLFGMVSVGYTVAGVIFLLRKTLRAKDQARKSYHGISIGVLIMFALIITSNFVFPVFFDEARYIQFGALFVFPFIALTSYAILKNKVFNVKIISTELFVTLLLVLSLLQLIQSEALPEILLRTGIFLSFIGVGILFIKSVLREVEQRERLDVLTKELQAANEKLTAFDKLKSEFLGFASHQVKSPMVVVKGFAELIYDGTYGQVSDEVKDKARKIKDSADRMIALVNNLLDLRKIEEGKMDFKFEQVDIAKVAGSMAEEFKIVAKNKGLDIQFEASKPSLVIKADEQKIRQVIQNLIDNSIKYTEKGFVKVKLEEQGDYVVISVSDSGRGMSPELQKKLFQQFVRDEQTKKEVQGTGLGLYIAKQIVEAHHGEIFAESEGENKGSKFSVRLSKE